MGRFVDSVIAYRILRMLTTPFKETDAYKLGIIDAKGKELKKMSDLNTADERNAYSILHRMVFRIKRIIERVPVEGKKLVTFAAALSLIKEHLDKNIEPINLESLYIDRLKEDLEYEIDIVRDTLSENKLLKFKSFVSCIQEDGAVGAGAPANNAAATPGVAGFTPDTLGVPKTKQPPLLRRKKVIKNV